MSVEGLREHGAAPDAPSRYVDAVTADLNALAATFEDVQNSRIRAENRGDLFSTALLADTEKRIGRHLGKTLKAHVLYDWLPKGLAGPRTARVLATIGDPRRFPGQPCTEGHILPPLFAEGASCPAESLDSRHENEMFDEGSLDTDEWPNVDETTSVRCPGGSLDFHLETEKLSEDSPGTADGHRETESVLIRCPGTMFAPRTSTGVASLWHYFGLIPGADGSLVSLKKGVQASYTPKGRALILGDKGIADQIVLHRTEPYRAVYDDFKSRRQTDELGENDEVPGLPPWRLNKIAKIVASKAFLGDLLVEWKQRVEVVG